MKIFAFHNYYKFPGGEDKSHQQEIELLRKNGHNISEFTFDNNSIKRKNLISTSLNSIWSIPVYNKYVKIFSIDKPDIIICQNFFPLISPSLFFAAKRNNIPTILFLRNYRLFCLNGLALLNNSPCEKCKRQFFPISGVINKCYRDNILASTSVAILLTTNRLLNTWQKKVDAFVTLSNFSKKMFIEAGIPKNKLYVRSNFLNSDPSAGQHNGNYFVSIGRLSQEKGILEIVDIWNKFKIQFKLKIIGNGPLEQIIKNKIKDNPNIEFLGYLDHSQVIEMLKKSYGLIMNSKWYEGMPRVLIEAFATATPVIVPNIGVFQEMVTDNLNGILFSPGVENDFLEKIIYAITHSKEWFMLGKNGRLEYFEKYSSNVAYKSLMELIYAIK
jgi:glycosyltransferase involved in cell wall biosynthesis